MRGSPQSAYVEIAAEPMLIIDDELVNWKILHVMNTGGPQKGPVLVIMKGKMTIYTAEGNKVHMSLHEFPQERYFFRCVDSALAEGLSEVLGQFNEGGHAIPRNDTNGCTIL